MDEKRVSGVSGGVGVLGRTFLYLFLRFSSDESGRDLTELCGTVCEGEMNGQRTQISIE